MLQHSFGPALQRFLKICTTYFFSDLFMELNNFQLQTHLHLFTNSTHESKKPITGCVYTWVSIIIFFLTFIAPTYEIDLTSIVDDIICTS